MTIFNLGSINADYVYHVAHFPAPGETLAATDFTIGLGGKGANQSIAAARGGARVVHIGSTGPDGNWAIEALRATGVEVDHIGRLDIPTGHAIIMVDPSGENTIVICPSANMAQQEGRIAQALDQAVAGDTCILQNETNLVAFTARRAQAKGMCVVYSAAPFDAGAAQAVLPMVDLLVVNAIEADQLAAALGVTAQNLPVARCLITRGSKGAIHLEGGVRTEVPAFKVTPVDTTGAGDTYLGFFVAGLDAGMKTHAAMQFAAAGAAIQVTRAGAAKAVPTASEVHAFLAGRANY